ncbi:alginate lyase family protein [Sorangium sp. So ce726]|uniref:alginate lyase family protein n=1 Tax=Sorangium sp. So ce726 TaxID=3133319 RepID=UPI003F5F884A
MMKTIHGACPRSLRWTLAPLMLALLAGCGGGEEDASTADDAVEVAEGAVTPTSFRHPGLFLTQTRLDNAKAAWNASTGSVMKTGYQVVLNDSRSAYTYSHSALSNVQVVGSAIGDQEARFKNDAQAAYLNALRWVKTGDARHRDKSIAILNDWAKTFRSFSVASGTNSAQVQLEAAWMLPVWVSAAEIIRHYNGGEAGWSNADIATFNGFVDRLYNEAEKARTRVNNWAVSAGLAMMAAGVYQDNAARYTAGLTRITEMIPLSVFSSGEVNELKDRDCTHPQYNLEGLSQAAEIAVIQAGDTSVWMWKGAGETTPRLAKGLEYMAKSLQSGSGVRNCKGQHMEAGYMDIAVNSYMNRGVAIPNFQSLAKAQRPDGGSMQFLGWTSATHGRDDY